MAKKKKEEEAPAATDEQKAPVMQCLSQFIRDLSFENVMAQQSIDGQMVPEVQVAISMDARKRDTDGQYEVIHKYKITSKAQGKDQILFVLELEYGGVFKVENIADDAIHPFLLIECSRMMFPYERRIVADITRDGGYPPLNLDTVDFLQLYRQELQRRAQAQSANTTPV